MGGNPVLAALRGMAEEDLRAHIAAVLERSGINPFDAERRAGLKRGYVNDFLIGKKQSLKNLEALARVLPLDPAGFIDGIAQAGVWRDPRIIEIPKISVPHGLRQPGELVFQVREQHAAGLGISDLSFIAVDPDDTSAKPESVVLVKRTNAEGAEEFSVRVAGAGGALSAKPAPDIPSIPDLALRDATIVGRVVRATLLLKPN